MTTSPHDTAQECADAFERTADTMMETWRVLVGIRNHPDPESKVLDDMGAAAASASANVLAAGDKIREAVTLLRAAVVRLRAIGQGAACADKTLWSAGPCSTCRTELATWDPRFLCDICGKTLCPFCLCEECNLCGVTRCKEHDHEEVH